MPMLAKAAAAAAPPQEAPAEADAGQQDFTAPGNAVDTATAVGAPPDPVRGASDARASAPTEGVAGGEQQATPEEQAEYERAIGAVETAMYANDKVSRAIVDQLQPGDKIASVVKASLLFIKQIDDKIDMSEIVIPEITKDVVDRMIDFAERVKNMEFSEKELQAVLGATWEGVMEVYGMDEESYAELTNGMSDQDIEHQSAQYKGFLGE